MLFQFAVLLLVLLAVSIVMSAFLCLIERCVNYSFRRVEKRLLNDFRGAVVLALLDARNERLIVSWLQSVSETICGFDAHIRLYRLERVSKDVQREIGRILSNDRSELCTNRMNEVCAILFGTFDRWCDEARASISKR